ncbi:MAG: hypothetical protein WBD13_02440 [Burkholderiaceae bacterium]
MTLTGWARSMALGKIQYQLQVARSLEISPKLQGRWIQDAADNDGGRSVVIRR